MSNEDLIPEEKFGRDHWSMLAYLETVAVDCAGFQVGLDAYMRHTRRHHRVMPQECPQPKRAKKVLAQFVLTMQPEHGTRLKDGTVLGDHDDFDCLQDLYAAGYFLATTDGVQPGVVLHLSAKGQRVASLLRAHKSAGGAFRNFEMIPATNGSNVSV